MAITETIRRPENVLRLAIVSHIDTGTVAARKFIIGFRPRYVLAFNETDGDKMEWFEGMADSSAIKHIHDTDPTKALITSLGISVSDSGFVIHPDTDMIVTDETVRWKAEA